MQNDINDLVEKHITHKVYNDSDGCEWEVDEIEDIEQLKRELIEYCKRLLN